MAQRNGIQKLLLSEFQEIKSEIKEIRQKDIPDLKVGFNGFKEQTKVEIQALKEKHGFLMKLYAGIGGLIAIVTSVAMKMLG